MVDLKCALPDTWKNILAKKTMEQLSGAAAEWAADLVCSEQRKLLHLEWSWLSICISPIPESDSLLCRIMGF